MLRGESAMVGFSLHAKTAWAGKDSWLLYRGSGKNSAAPKFKIFRMAATLNFPRLAEESATRFPQAVPSLEERPLLPARLLRGAEP